MRPETHEKYEKAKALIAGGENVTEACKAVKLGVSNYYFIKAGSKPSKKYKKTYKTKKRQSYIDIPLQSQPAASDKITVIVCHTHQLKNLLEGLT